MHGNTYENRHSRKTRKFEDILNEIHDFFELHKAEGTIAGGVHLELTGDSVTECIGGSRRLTSKEAREQRISRWMDRDPRLREAVEKLDLTLKE